MINNLFKQFKLVLPKGKYRFSKLLHFYQNYPIYGLDLSKFTINTFSTLLDGANDGNSIRFNVSLTNYINTNGDTDNEQIIKLVNVMYENNIYCSKQNKEWFIEQFKSRFGKLNSESINVLFHYQLIGINNLEIIKNLVQEFKFLNLQNISYPDRLALLYLFGSFIKRNSGFDTKCNQFQQKWNQLITHLAMDINSQDASRYQYIAQVLRTIDNKEIAEDFKFVFERLTQNFKQSSNYSQMSTKDIAILLTSLLKIRETMLNEEINLIINNLLTYLTKADFNEFNNVSLYTIILSLTNLPDFQKQIGENIVTVLKQRIERNGCQPKYYFGAFCEIYQRWEVPLPRYHLSDMIQIANLSEFSEADLTNYLQLLMLLPIETIISTINNIEQVLKLLIQPLIQKFTKKKDSWLNRSDQSSMEKIRKYLLKLNSMALNNQRKIESLERITNLFQ